MVFSKSENFKAEYSCTIVRVGAIEEVKDSTFLGVTMVEGFPIVVRRDQVKEGDIMVYVANECELNPTFCKKNNLFEDSSLNEDSTKKGYFNKYGRVRIVKLRGQASMGYLFGAEELVNSGLVKKDFKLSIADVETMFDSIGGEIFVKPYVPRVKSSNRVVSNKRNKKLKLFNRVIPGEFSFHYDTDQLERNMHMFRPNDDISISVKLHGTSAIIGNVKTLKPKWNGLYAKIFSFLPKFLQRTTTEYDYICSSRSVIINGIYMNDDKESFGSDVQREIYEYMKLLKSVGALDKGETIYGEIVGYYTGTSTPIQKMGKPYDYGCNVGESKLMIYRVNLDSNGVKEDMNVDEVLNWTNVLIHNHPELSNKIMPINLLYHGKMQDLYPDIDTENVYTWREAFISRLSNDKNFGMEKTESLCKNNVPREGIVVRKDNDIIKEAFKLKCMKFRFKEAESIDNGEVDAEMEQAYC